MKLPKVLNELVNRYIYWENIYPPQYRDDGSYQPDDHIERFFHLDEDETTDVILFLKKLRKTD